MSINSATDPSIYMGIRQLIKNHSIAPVLLAEGSRPSDQDGSATAVSSLTKLPLPLPALPPSSVQHRTSSAFSKTQSSHSTHSNSNPNSTGFLMSSTTLHPLLEMPGTPAGRSPPPEQDSSRDSRRRGTISSLPSHLLLDPSNNSNRTRKRRDTTDRMESTPMHPPMLLNDFVRDRERANAQKGSTYGFQIVRSGAAQDTPSAGRDRDGPRAFRNSLPSADPRNKGPVPGRNTDSGGVLNHVGAYGTPPAALGGLSAISSRPSLEGAGDEGPAAPETVCGGCFGRLRFRRSSTGGMKPSKAAKGHKVHPHAAVAGAPGDAAGRAAGSNLVDLEAAGTASDVRFGSGPGAAAPDLASRRDSSESREVGQATGAAAIATASISVCVVEASGTVRVVNQVRSHMIL